MLTWKLSLLIDELVYKQSILHVYHNYSRARQFPNSPLLPLIVGKN